jgi:hypothetical protein
MNFLRLLLIISSALFLLSCQKEAGKGGQAKISGKVLHHSTPIPFASVFIHYGSLESPGNQPSQYQDSTKADAQGFFEFKELHKGKYYLYSTGWDGLWTPPSVVFGGVPAEIFQRKEAVEISLPVSE